MVPVIPLAVGVVIGVAGTKAVQKLAVVQKAVTIAGKLRARCKRLGQRAIAKLPSKNGAPVPAGPLYYPS